MLPRYPPISNLYLLHFFFLRISIRNLSFSRRRERNGRKTDGCEPAAKASISITRMPIVYRFRSSFFATPLSLSLFLLSPFPSGNFDISFLVPTRGNVDYVFNGVPLVWWEISFKAWRLAYSANLSKFEEFVENVLSKGCCTNFYLSANWKINFWWISFFFFRSSSEKIRLNLHFGKWWNNFRSRVIITLKSSLRD